MKVLFIPLLVFLSLLGVFGSAAALQPESQQVVLNPQASIDEHALLRTVAVIFDLDPALLEAIARNESNLNPNAVSPKGAIGLMQLMPATAARFGVVDPFDPVDNALGAARFLVYLRKEEAERTGSAATVTPEVIAAYNAGEGAVARYGGVPPYPETREYVRRVLTSYLFGSATPLQPMERRRLSFASPPPRLPSSGNPDLDLLEQLSSLRREREKAARRSRSDPVVLRMLELR